MGDMVERGDGRRYSGNWKRITSLCSMSGLQSIYGGVLDQYVLAHGRRWYGDLRLMSQDRCIRTARVKSTMIAPMS